MAEGRFMIDGETTGGAFSLVEHPLPPRALGAPLHTHRNEDEYSYVLEGRVGVQLGDDSCSKPHRATSSREMAPLPAATDRDEAALGEVVARYELDIDFTTIPVLTERHGLRLE